MATTVHVFQLSITLYGTNCRCSLRWSNGDFLFLHRKDANACLRAVLIFLLNIFFFHDETIHVVEYQEVRLFSQLAGNRDDGLYILADSTLIYPHPVVARQINVHSREGIDSQEQNEH